MNKTAYIILPFFILATAAFLSLGMECLLLLLGSVMKFSLDSSVQYPRFIPFCIACGIVALLGLVAMIVLNAKASKKFGFTKFFWRFECIFALVLSIPAIKIWETLFDFLQKAV